jgi:hypothetical protein
MYIMIMYITPTNTLHEIVEEVTLIEIAEGTFQRALAVFSTLEKLAFVYISFEVCIQPFAMHDVILEGAYIHSAAAVYVRACMCVYVFMCLYVYVYMCICVYVVCSDVWQRIIKLEDNEMYRFA